MSERREALLTPREAAARLNVPVDRVYRLSQAGRLPRVQLGRTVRFDPAALSALIVAGGFTESTADSSPDATDRQEVHA